MRRGAFLLCFGGLPRGEGAEELLGTDGEKREEKRRVVGLLRRFGSAAHTNKKGEKGKRKNRAEVSGAGRGEVGDWAGTRVEVLSRSSAPSLADSASAFACARLADWSGLHHVVCRWGRVRRSFPSLVYLFFFFFVDVFS